MANRLKHSKSGRVYPYNEFLARRDDMVVIDDKGSVISDAPQDTKPRKKAASKAQSPDDLVSSLTNDIS